VFCDALPFVVQDWLKEQEAIMEKNGEENIDLHIERLTIATVSCVRYSLQKKWRQKKVYAFLLKVRNFYSKT
jgi:hypothetical protein